MIGQIYPENKWALDRLGNFTGSEISSLLTEPRTKAAREAGEMSETAKSYIRKKASELITGTVRDFSNAAVEWGNSYEKEAAEELQKIYPELEYFGNENQKFFPLTKFSGGSPDLVGGKLVAECKCPENPANHVEYCLLETQEDLLSCNKDYYYQIQMNMMCVAKDLGVDFSEMSGLFASYCPIVTDGFIKLKTIDIKPDLELSEKILKAIEKAENVLADIIEKLRNPSVFVAEYEEEVNATVIS